MQFPIERFKDIRTPFYYYDSQCLQSTLDKVNNILKRHENYQVHYAIKANANSQILSTIAKTGLGADCVSGGEIKAAIQAGFLPENIVFAGVGKNDDEINLALDYDIFCFNVESISELNVINALAHERCVTARIALRINPNVDAHTDEKITTGLKENKFGIGVEEVIPAVQLASGLSNISFLGLHFHIGSQILDNRVFANLCEKINQIQKELEFHGIFVRHINVGGGLGINYEQPDDDLIPDFKSYFAVFTENLVLREGQKLHFELGRSIVAQCGALISKVLYIKHGHYKSFLIMDAGFTDLLRPAFYGAYHKIENLSSKSFSVKTKYDIVGPICESSDIFAKNVDFPLSKRGDYIAFRSAGAYGEVMASTYNCRTLPGSVFI